ncbi:GNAT family N-acetyltransferase [Polyangium sp. 6x1]|uniref:GNAT family N-acetyltransferase n=1 Tax=Polyangium sp. 6x1 TaxID=3042689 RepID=UPI0024828A3C|nr:GNAT family N-acetyltransferase [Polyangium sp. 6x1]MDI1445799.1 GNAT family N-acetyltransferase [Polyangium sp. 6x1]
MDRAGAVALLARAPAVHLASTTPEGEPVLRVLHGVVVGDHLLFHGAPVGEKMDVVGRRAVISAEEIVASIPSYFVDPERACPATTFYRSAQVHGTIERVDAPHLKAAMLAALMEKYQPEGGYAPIDAEHPLYKKAVAGVLVLGVSLERLDGKAKLGQNRTPAEIGRLLDLLWARGAPGDARAIDLVRAASPSLAAPSFLEAPADATLLCAMGEADADEATALLVGTYWCEGTSSDRIRRSLLGSSAWVGARDRSGALVGTARAIADGARRAWIYDVIVDDAWRGRGLGRALMRLLLNHPAVRGAETVLLRTRDAMGFYEPFGFRTRHVHRTDGREIHEMILARTEASGEAACPLASAGKGT